LLRRDIERFNFLKIKLGVSENLWFLQRKLRIFLEENEKSHID
jgi:hypothetical protein